MKILNGFEDGTFRPDNVITREEFAAILCRAFKIPISEQDVRFNDVPEGCWFEGYVNDISQSGVMQGTGDGMFGAGESLIRQDLAVITYRLLDMKLVAAKAIDNTVPDFNDMAEVSDYAMEAVGTMKKSGIINGMGNNMFVPFGEVTRAQAAQIIFNLIR